VTRAAASGRRRGRLGAAALLALAGLAACAPPQQAPPPAPAPVQAAPKPPAASASAAAAQKLAIAPEPGAAARITADVAFLASPDLDGRGTGEEGARRAADYVVRRFSDLKLKPLGDAGKDAGKEGRSYLQAFEARVGATVEPPVVRVSRRPQKKGPEPLDAKGLTTAEGSDSGSAKGDVVFVGHGITAPALGWDNYAGADVAGKIVVVLDGAPKLAATADKGGHEKGGHGPPDPLRDFGSPRYKLRTAREHKAAGVIIVASGDELPKAAHDSAPMGVPGVVVARSAADKLFPPLKLRDKATWEPAKAPAARPIEAISFELTTRVTPRMAPSWNVVAMLPAREGSPRAGEYVVVGAHYDHLGHGGSTSRAPGSSEIHPGADDNASGTALLLEVARRFVTLPARPERNVVFVAFGAEEVGTIGSRWFVDHPPQPIGSVKQIAAMINADMVGRLRDGKLLVDGVGTSQGWEGVVKPASDGLGLTLTYGAEGFGASDHAPFTAARVPVAFLFTGVHDDYHRPSDTADKVNAEGAARIAALAARMALSVSQRDERLAFTDPPSDPHRGRRGGFRVSLGTLPDYAYQGKGLRITGARPDSPAARAGMQAGDVIVKLGTHEVTNIHDYMFAMGELEPGREVVIEVERAGARVPLKVIPAPGK